MSDANMIDLLALAPREAEAYALGEGLTKTAKLFGRIADAMDREKIALDHIRAIIGAVDAGDDVALAIARAAVYLDKLEN